VRMLKMPYEEKHMKSEMFLPTEKKI
jgi:hypothetical protein